jgi:hypothetical protein
LTSQVKVFREWLVIEEHTINLLLEEQTHLLLLRQEQQREDNH